MLFSSLMNLSYAESGRIELDALRQALPSTPEDILIQVYADHGRNCAFQKQYGHLDISRIEWQLDRVPAEEIVVCTVWRDFQDWFDSVAARVNAFATHGWKCVDVRADVRLSWECERTWIRPPILLGGVLAPYAPRLHLVEGHTRIGLLRGLIAAGVLSGMSEHLVWIGRAPCS
ncbi:hypothetical protein [Stenotrophomonas sp. GD03654]|uniref:hypothetical protein n=1 Tax=Stenotrophomonas TaxID=40323 RepID=UPI0013D9945A|nr:hypothetical protein [Stenotrophomonas sp. GD03654]MDH2178240.1 hypothetical protein [Stenotrophomonas sp. GD03654]